MNINVDYVDTLWNAKFFFIEKDKFWIMMKNKTCKSKWPEVH